MYRIIGYYIAIGEPILSTDKVNININDLTEEMKAKYPTFDWDKVSKMIKKWPDRPKWMYTLDLWLIQLK